MLFSSKKNEKNVIKINRVTNPIVYLFINLPLSTTSFLTEHLNTCRNFLETYYVSRVKHFLWNFIRTASSLYPSLSIFEDCR